MLIFISLRDVSVRINIAFGHLVHIYRQITQKELSTLLGSVGNEGLAMNFGYINIRLRHIETVNRTELSFNEVNYLH